jgi:tRNA pseudouridine13 synthase
MFGTQNLQGALDIVPRNTMLMYVHAYQSFVWNKIVSKRIKEFGLKPIVGDLVYENPDLKDDVETVNYDTQHPTDEDGKSSNDLKLTADKKEQKIDGSNLKNENSDKVNDVNQYKNTQEKKEDSKTEDDKYSDKDDIERQIPKVKILTEEDLPNYTLANVVMPQPGWKVTYPPYAKSWFDEYLGKDGLTTDLKQKNK